MYILNNSFRHGIEKTELERSRYNQKVRFKVAFTFHSDKNRVDLGPSASAIESLYFREEMLNEA